jgi:glyoxylase-like metal-dependent hydrolase (beta-lactamase superfamily II)
VRAVDPRFLRGAGEVLTDGEVLEVAGLRITVLATPGHTEDSVSFLLADAVLTGDTVLGSGTTVLEARDGALGDYLDSMDQLVDVAQGRALLPAHGPDHPAADPVVRYYIRHRQERLDQVREALRVLGADATPEQVVERVYADVDKSLWPVAQSSVQAQLSYLRNRN